MKSKKYRVLEVRKTMACDNWWCNGSCVLQKGYGCIKHFIYHETNSLQKAKSLAKKYDSEIETLKKVDQYV